MTISECILQFLTLHILNFFDFNFQEEKNEKNIIVQDEIETRYPFPNSLRLKPMNYSDSSQYFEEDEPSGVVPTHCGSQQHNRQHLSSCSSAKKNDGDDRCTCPNTFFRRFNRKITCIYQGAKFGIREGALSGVFLGGILGLYKYFDGAYVNKKGEEAPNSGSEENKSTVNESIIFVTAAHGAIIMAVFGTLFCSMKAAMYCN